VKKNKKRIIALLLLKGGISALLVFLVLRRIPLVSVWARIREVDPLLLASTLPLSALVILASAWRWSLLSLGLIRLGTAIRYTWIGMFYGAILPGGVSGDIAKGASLALRRSDVRVSRLPISILTDRLVGFTSLLALFNLSCARLSFSKLTANVPLALFGEYGFGLSLIALLGAALAASPFGRRVVSSLSGKLLRGRSREFAGRVQDAFYEALARPNLLGRTLALSLGIHLLNIAAYFIVLRALGTQMHLAEVAVFYASMSVIVMVPISISGLGLRDWFSLGFFTALGLAGETGVAFSWISLGVGILVALLGGLIQLWEIFRATLHPAIKPGQP
jgi:uncharacterized protein (TIRG00374 family)